MNYLFDLGGLGIFIFFILSVVVLFLIFPYVYVLVRLISKAWFKSKNEERSY
jgi:heme/copper-type cytochrome/quinol oxidase subunit 3